MITSIILLILGLGVLTYGADLLVKGASTFAARLGIPPLIVGLTVVAFGTSAPELAVSMKAAVTGQAELSLGNVVGSNIFNIVLILGISAIITPLMVSRQLVRLDVPIMVGVSILLWLLTLDGSIGFFEAAFLSAGLFTYIAIQVFLGLREAAKENTPTDAPPAKPAGFARDAIFFLLGLGLLVLGARWFVFGAIDIARWLGLSELVIGLTLVAAGTSLPEVAASIAASLRGERDLAVGNVVGSNIFNILGVLGFSGLLASGGIDVAQSARIFDIPVMVLVATICIPIFVSGFIVSRAEGAVFLCLYIVYTTVLVLTATGRMPLDSVAFITDYLLLPIVAVAMIAWSVLIYQRQKHPP